MISSGVLSLIVFVVFIAIFIWDKLPMGTSAILGCVVMVLLGLADFETAFGQFASNTVIILVSIQIVGAAMSETGLASAFGSLLTKVSRNNERVIMLVAYLMSALLSSFMTNVTVLAIFMPIIVGMGAKDKRIHPLNLVLPVVVGTSMGGISTMMGSTQQLTAKGLVEAAGFTMKVFDLTPVGAILTLAGLLYCLFIGYPLGKKIWGDRDLSDCTVAAPENVEFKKSKIITMCVIFVLMIAGYVTEVVPIAVTAVSAAILCILTGCIKQKTAVSRINWDAVGRLGGCLGLAKCLSAAGGIDILSDAVLRLFGGSMTPFVLFVLAVVVTQVLSLVMSNSTAILIVLPIVISLAGGMNLNLVAYGLGAALGSSMGVSCPLSGSTYTMSMAAGYKFKDYFRYGILLDIISCVIIIVFTPMFFSLTL